MENKNLANLTSPSYGLTKKQEDKRNEDINKQLRTDKKRIDAEVKLLLLGSGDSGKSTFAKQMKIIHLGAFKTKDELLSFRPLIFQNTIQAMKDLLSAAKDLSINVTDQESASIVEKCTNLEELKKEVGTAIQKLWQDPGIKETFSRKSEFQLIDSAAYFFENLGRLTGSEFVPTVQDVLRARQKTTGVLETEFQIDQVTLRLIDVGGQRTERTKWIHFFQDVTAVLFVVALSEYDLKLEEDNKTNRMHESLKVFNDVTNNKWFVNTPIILFLNKRDLFEDKIKRIDLKVCFNEYQGGKNFDNATAYIKKKFAEQCQNKEKPIYSHITMATDTNNIAVVFNAVRDIILRKMVSQSGLDI